MNNPAPIPLIIHGITGRMGRRLVALSAADPERRTVVLAGIAKRGEPEIGSTLDGVPVVEEFSKAFGKPITSVSRESMEALKRHAWPGNVRDLRNVVEHAMILATGPRLAIPVPEVRASDRQKSLRLEDVEAAHILGVLDRTKWRVRGPQGAADLLGIKPTTLEGRMARLGLRRPAP